MISIDEARKLRRQLEERIAAELATFTEATGMGVSSLDLRRIDSTTMSDGTRRFKYAVDIETKL